MKTNPLSSFVKKTAAALLGVVVAGAVGAQDPEPNGYDPIGANTALDLFAPSVAGREGFTTGAGSAAASALNPAAGGEAERMVFEIGYLNLADFGGSGDFGNVVNLGALFPTRVGVFGGSLRLIQSPFDTTFPVETSVGLNLNAAKELYTGMSIGVGLDVGYNTGSEFTIAGDLGFRYNTGKLGPLENFTWAVTLRGLGKTWIPSLVTPEGGVSFDALHIKSATGGLDPFKITVAADLGFPTFQNVAGKLGVTFTIAEFLALSTSTQFNLREFLEDSAPSFIPSIGLTFKFNLKSGGERILDGLLPSDGEIDADIVAKPLYGDIWALGAGISWLAGGRDNRAPEIAVTYPTTFWMSPNNDGKADALEFPLSITDDHYIAGWTLEILNDAGEVVRTTVNKDRRPETEGFGDFWSRLTDVKSGVEVPETLRWDGILESGAVAPDGRYTFVLRATDDYGNAGTSEVYEVMVDNTPPEIVLDDLPEGENVFSPDGDGNKETLTLTLAGSVEDLWDGGIYNSAGNLVRHFSYSSASPEPLEWDGANDAGAIVPDGVYSFSMGSTDKALNSAEASLGNIVVSTLQPSVGLTISDAWFSPNGDGVKDTLTFTLDVPVKDSLVNWELIIRDTDGTPRRTIPGTGAPPGSVNFDGANDLGLTLPEATYTADFYAHYRNGYVAEDSSPSFTLDVTPPRAVIAVEDGVTVFSPNNDGNKDEIFLTQSGSREVQWTGEVRPAAGGNAVRTVRFPGEPTARIEWDGVTDGGALAPDGAYEYALSATDQAGNTGRSNTVSFEIFTRDTAVLLSADLRAFSPNGDGVKDSINLLPTLQETSGIASWKLQIQSAGADSHTWDPSATMTRVFEGASTAPPASIAWNGRTDAGAAAPDGDYLARIEITYRAGNEPVALSRSFTLDTKPPEATVSAAYTLFSPNADNRRDTLPLQVTTPGSDEWTASILDVRNTPVRTWTWTGQPPQTPLTWDGADAAGNRLADGSYSFLLTSSDEAGNSARQTLGGIVLDARVPRAIFTAAPQAIAPKTADDAVRFNVSLTPSSAVAGTAWIDSWQLEIKDDTGRAVRTFQGQGSAPPALLSWNGTDDRGALREGKFTTALTVTYAKGDVVTAATSPVTVDVSGPVLSYNSTPVYFSPDNDGVDDELSIYLGARDISPIANWSLEIRETQGTQQLFYRLDGRGSPAERIRWDGRSSRGELVQAATDYTYVFTATDTLGNSSSLNGVLSVDVLVIRDGDTLRIQVPSITFKSESADFLAGVTAAQRESNERVLRRITEILNKFKDYRITVEGHANPILGTAKEETEELQPLSQKRAQAIVDWLASNGVSRSRLNAIGRGGTRALVKANDMDNNWKNRRVEFILIK